MTKKKREKWRKQRAREGEKMKEKENKERINKNRKEREKYGKGAKRKHDDVCWHFNVDRVVC